jgi:putative methyltransferase (TIGR04325 family)
MASLAPIILFTYNRPLHMKKVLDALAENKEAAKSALHIFCDGPKPESTAEEMERLNEVRRIAYAENRFATINVTESAVNKGLSKSIIEGISEVINESGNAIIVEDDIVASRGFLHYMNEALAMYEAEEKVGCIHGWNYDLDASNYSETTFFLKGGDCWGWATWKRAWNLFNPDGIELLEAISSRNLQFEFDRRGTHKFVDMLKDQIEGKNNSWAVRWHASLFINDKYCLQPARSLVKNIGLDSSGVHCGISSMRQHPVESIDLKKIKVRESEWFYRAFAASSKQPADSPRNGGLRKMIRPFIPPVIYSIKDRFRARSGKIWSGRYERWADAQALCTGYDSNVILEKCRNALISVKNGEAIYERDSVLFYEMEYNWPLIAALQRTALEHMGSLCMLDFGGSLGSTYFQNKQYLKSIAALQWNIVEQSHFVDCGRKEFEDGQLNFFYTVEECIKHCMPNVLLLSSVLQYLEYPHEWLQRLVSLDIEYIIVDRTSFTDRREDFISIQQVPEEIYPASLRHWFFSERRFEKHFDGKYEQLVRVHSQFQLNIDDSVSLFLLYKRIE